VRTKVVTGLGTIVDFAGTTINAVAIFVARITVPEYVPQHAPENPILPLIAVFVVGEVIDDSRLAVSVIVYPQSLPLKGTLTDMPVTERWLYSSVLELWHKRFSILCQSFISFPSFYLRHPKSDIVGPSTAN